MEYLEEIEQRARSIQILEIVDRVILEQKETIIKKVISQWKRGVRPDGSIIGNYRSFVYMQEKLRRNPLAQGNVDLIDTGALSEGLTINKITKAVYTIFSDDSKAQMIADKYGLDVYGLSDDEKENFIDMAVVVAIDEIVTKIYA